MPEPGRRAVAPDEQALVDRLVEAVAAAYVALTPDVRARGSDAAPVLGVTLQVYWDGGDAAHWAPTASLVTEATVARHGPAEAWAAGEDGTPPIEWPNSYADPVLREPGDALLALIHDREAWELRNVFFLRLAERLASAWGVPVAVDDFEDGILPPAAEHVREQLGPERAADWVARGWLPPSRDALPPPAGALVAVRTADGRWAGIGAGGLLTGDLGSGGGTVVRPGEASVHEAGGERAMVVGGGLPPGATGARVQDLFDVWHDATVAVDGGLWACALPHARRGGRPPVAFVDAGGAEIPTAAAEPDEGWILEVDLDDVDEDATLDGLDQEELDDEPDETPEQVRAVALVPPLWDPALGPGELTGWGRSGGAVTSLSVFCRETSVTTERGRLDDPERVARDRLEWALEYQLGRRAAARAVIEAQPRVLAATVDGATATFVLLAAGNAWIAVLGDSRARLVVRAQGRGAPPARLDLRPLEDPA